MANILVRSENRQYVFDPEKPFAKPGKFSTIYLGACVEDKQPYILKVLNTTTYNNELKFIDHCSFVNVVDQFEFNKKLVVVKPFYEGKQLFELYQAGFFKTKIGKQILPEVIKKVSEGLKFIHDNNIIHRDIRPHNLLVVFSDKIDPQNFEIKILDHAQSTPINFVHNGNLPFSLLYASPEQVLQQHDLVDQTSDIYSLAITLLEILTGILPYKNHNPELLIHLMLVTPPKGIDLVIPEVRDIILKASNRYSFKRPPTTYSLDELRSKLLEAKSQRFQNVNEFSNELIDALKIKKTNRFFNWIKN